MLDLERAMTGTTLTLDDKNLNADLEKQLDQLLTKDLKYIEDDVEAPTKDEPELDEDLSSLGSATLELEEIPEGREDLAPLPGAPEMEETATILVLPTVPVER
ncbi:MAG: hypothetical protein M3Y81_29485, partial [Chloroflexota bacterium]|nr:hypothetical protein [Chloroflexota bacterium]